MEAAGNEPASPSPEPSILQGFTPTPSKPLAQTLARDTTRDPALAQLVEAWPAIPEAIRAGIVAMVNASSKGRHQK